MLSVCYRKRGLLEMNHVWFADPEEVRSRKWRELPGDVVFLHGVAEEIPGAFVLSRQRTLVKDLSVSEEEMFAGLDKDTRKKVRRARRDQVRTEFLDSGQLQGACDRLVICERLYNKMFRDKYGARGSRFNMKLVEAYVSRDAFVLGISWLQDRPVGFKGMIVCRDKARSYISAFDFRNTSNDPQAVGRAHVLLEVESFRHLKARGVLEYDFGGVNSFEEPDGIARFKMEFERNRRVEYFNYLIPLTVKGRLALAWFRLKGLLGRCGRR